MHPVSSFLPFSRSSSSWCRQFSPLALLLPEALDNQSVLSLRGERWRLRPVHQETWGSGPTQARPHHLAGSDVFRRHVAEAGQRGRGRRASPLQVIPLRQRLVVGLREHPRRYPVLFRGVKCREAVGLLLLEAVRSGIRRPVRLGRPEQVRVPDGPQCAALSDWLVGQGDLAGRRVAELRRRAFGRRRAGVDEFLVPERGHCDPENDELERHTQHERTVLHFHLWTTATGTFGKQHSSAGRRDSGVLAGAAVLRRGKARGRPG